MFAKLAVSLLALAAAVSAGPIAARGNSLAARTEWPNFSSWHGISSLDRFDDFYGSDNFSGSHNQQVVVKKNELVCRPVQIEIVQQRLAVIREVYKKIITEQICEVETQIIVHQQAHGGLGGFSRDLRRHSGREVGFDSNVVGHWGELFGNDGFISTHDLGFRGHDVGKNTVVFGGHNWVDATSPISVGSAYDLARNAFVSED